MPSCSSSLSGAPPTLRLSHPHTRTPAHPHTLALNTLTHSHPHTRIPSHPHLRTPFRTPYRTPSHPHNLALRTLTHSHPHTRVPSHPHLRTPFRTPSRTLISTPRARSGNKCPQPVGPRGRRAVARYPITGAPRYPSTGVPRAVAAERARGDGRGDGDGSVSPMRGWRQVGAGWRNGGRWWWAARLLAAPRTPSRSSQACSSDVCRGSVSVSVSVSAPVSPWGAGGQGAAAECGHAHL